MIKKDNVRVSVTISKEAYERLCKFVSSYNKDCLMPTSKSEVVEYLLKYFLFVSK